MSRLEKGCVQVYTGNGKGKTTCALGLCFRATGHGFKSAMVQFMKGNTEYGEIKAAGKISGMDIYQFGTPDLIRKGNEREIDFEEAERALQKARQLMEDPELSILILDEVNVALYFELIRLEDVLELIDSKPPHLELVLTGRKVPDEILEKADLVTRFEEVRHYYNTVQLQARRGIEY